MRFICGTQDIHKTLESKIAEFLHTEDTISTLLLLMQTAGCLNLTTAEDAIISDSLNHASIIDGVRLCKAARYRYANNDMTDLEKQLQAAEGHGLKSS